MMVATMTDVMMHVALIGVHFGGAWLPTIHEPTIHTGRGPGVADTVARAELVLEIGTADHDPDEIFGRIAGMAVGTDGRIAVVDRIVGSLRVFAPSGELEFGVAGFGEAPGEFSPDLTGVAFGGDGEVVALDPGLQRLTIFDRGGAVLETVQLPDVSERIMEWQQPFAGRVLEWVRWPRTQENVLRCRDLTTGETSVLLRFEFREAADGAGSDESIELLGERPLWTAHPDGRPVWTVTGTSGQAGTVWMKVEGDGLDSLDVGGLGLLPAPELDTQRLHQMATAAWADALGQDPHDIAFISERFSLPDALPAITGLQAGPEGTVLVQRASTEDELDGLALFSLFGLPLGGDDWHLLDPDRNRHGAVAGFSSGFTAFAVHGTNVYGVHRDELGVHRIHVYRLRID